MATAGTKKLKIPLLEGPDLVSKEGINNALQAVEDNAVDVGHLKEPSHLPMWKDNTVYGLKDVVRTTTGPPWGIYVCITAGTSGNAEPQGFGEGDIITDGSVQWKLQSFGGGGANIADWAANAPYSRYDFCLYNNRLFRCLAAHTAAAAFEPQYWQGISIDIADFVTGRYYLAGDIALYQGDLYRCKATHLANLFINANWDAIGISRRKAILYAIIF